MADSHEDFAGLGAHRRNHDLVRHADPERQPHTSAGDDDGPIRVALHNLKLRFQIEPHLDQPFLEALACSQKTDADLVTFGGHRQRN